MKKILLDTNIIIDALADRNPYAAPAQQILIDAAEGRTDAYVTATTVTDIAYLLHKYQHNASKVRRILADLFDSISILDVTSADCTNALTGILADYEDAVMEQCAFRNSMDLLITRNLKDFKNSRVTVISSAQYKDNH